MSILTSGRPQAPVGLWKFFQEQLLPIHPPRVHLTFPAPSHTFASFLICSQTGCHVLHVHVGLVSFLLLGSEPESSWVIKATASGIYSTSAPIFSSRLRRLKNSRILNGVLQPVVSLVSKRISGALFWRDIRVITSSRSGGDTESMCL